MIRNGVIVVHSFPVFYCHQRMFTRISRQNQTLGGEENMFAIQVNVCYILKHLEERVICSYLSHLISHHSHFQTVKKNSAYA